MDMKKDIAIYIIEIIITIGIVVFSIPMWNDFATKKNVMEETMAMSGLELSNDSESNDDELNVTTGTKLSSNNYYVTNNSTYNVSGVLLFKYSKRSILNYNYLNINVNDYNCSLNLLYDSEDDNYYIFKLSNFNLNGGEAKQYSIALSVKDDYLAEASKKSFVYNLQIINDNSNL